MHRSIRRTFPAVVVLGALGVGTYALWPARTPVDAAGVTRGPLVVTVDEDGRTRTKERYVVSAPLAGRLARVTLREGDAVKAGETLLAAIDPVDPSLLDPRARAEAVARVRAAEAALERASAAVLAAGSAMELAQTEQRVQREAYEKGAGTAIELERAAIAAAIRKEEYRAAGFERDMARFELEQNKAALLRAGQGTGTGEDGRFGIPAPITGRVLRVIQESAAVVQPGAPLIEIGDPTDLELVVDVLSRDAVAIRPGARAILEHWGGEYALAGRVRLVEPSAFTKISALGVEEQRVNVVIDLVDPPERHGGLGDGFRVEARIVVWESSEAITVPTSALFRRDRSWAVFTIEGGRAVVRDIEVGRRNASGAEVLSGLTPEDVVITYPSDRVRAGTRVRARAP